ncbi:hypothetical protein CISG_08959 [Coccidioides immitis RMSCC 3703]|uniref:Uncharacterized protein n=1 Tax=Coccidioides immitis RMSCC 3703 TaxID=454286 RepID=A0A0J8R728_COCIT|nr:hypothetical protein CISG_08959 [Coccidioides immitis RMSCC 3703]
MQQFSCNPPRKGVPEAPGVVRCESVVRIFRRCANGVSAETTALEGHKYKDVVLRESKRIMSYEYMNEATNDSDPYRSLQQ